MIEIGSPAPDFALSDKNGNIVRLSDFKGRKIALYFYPRDNTPGCTRQALGYGELYGEFLAKGAEVIGISRDSAASHAKFAEKHGLPFVLLSDPELSAIRGYGVWQEKKQGGKTSMGVVRTSFLIDEDGIVRAVMPKVKPDSNAKDVLELLK